MVELAQGEIWWADLPEPTGSGPGLRRPVVIVQGDHLNRSRIATAVCVPLTSNLTWSKAPGNVLLSDKATGLPKDSVATYLRSSLWIEHILPNVWVNLVRKSLHRYSAASMLFLVGEESPPNKALQTDKCNLSCLLHSQKPRQFAFAAELVVIRPEEAALPTIEELRERRFLFLRRLYETSGGSRHHHVVMWDVGKELGFSKEETSAICEFLAGEYLLEHVHLGGGVAITHDGVVEIENAVSHPDKATEYFPAVNVIHIHNMHQSQIQQGTFASSQSATYSADPQLISAYIAELTAVLPSLNLDADTKSEAEAEIATIGAQLSSARPKQNILKECLVSIRTILEGAAGNVLAQQLLSQLTVMGV